MTPTTTSSTTTTSASATTTTTTTSSPSEPFCATAWREPTTPESPTQSTSISTRRSSTTTSKRTTTTSRTASKTTSTSSSTTTQQKTSSTPASKSHTSTEVPPSTITRERLEDVTKTKSTKKDKASTRSPELTSTRGRTPPSPTTSKEATTETDLATTTSATSTRPPKKTSPAPTFTDMMFMSTTSCATEEPIPMEEMAPVNQTRCESPCEHGWTEGEEDCMKALDVESTSYRNLSILCSRIGGVSLPVQTDFENHKTYQLMEVLAKSRIPPSEWVFMEPDPNGDYRLDRKVTAVNVTKFVMLGGELHVQKHPDDAVAPNVTGICRKPRFCVPQTCNLTRYLLPEMAMHLIPTDDKRIFEITELATLNCNVTGKTHEARCTPSGFFSPSPDRMECYSEESLEELEEQKRKAAAEERVAMWYQNKTIRDCRQCDMHGTEECAQKQAGVVECLCKEGWIGDTCGKSPDFCAKGDNCKNGGECVNFVTHFYCECEGNFKGADCSVNVDRLNYSDPIVIRTFVPGHYIYALGSGILGCLFYYNAFGDIKHPQMWTQVHKYAFLLVAFVCSGLFRHPDVFSLEPYIGCRTHNWIINTAWVLGLHAWLMEAHLCWTTMSNQAMNVWDFNNKWYLSRENRLKAIVVPSLVFTTVSHVLFWEEVPHSWSCIGTFHDSGSSHVILNFSMVLTIAMYSVSWAQTAWNYRRKKWNQYVRFYRTTNDDPWEYGKHMECYGSWVLSIMANDLYNEKVTDWFCSWTIAYLFLLMAQTAQTNNNALCFFKNFCTIYGPYHWAPRINYSSMLYRMEYVELKQPERHKRLFEAAERRRQKKRDKEWAAIEKKNDELRKRFAADTGLPPEDCPQRHLFHHPEEGPAKMFPAPYKIKPGDRNFLPLLLRDFFSKELVKAYLTNRKELPEPNGRKAALHAILRTCRAKLWHFRGKHSHALAQFWTDISNYIVDKDRHVAPKRIDDALAILATRDMSLQKAAFTIDWDNAMGPMEAIRLKDLDVIMHCQVPYFMETFEENLAVVNARFDAFYEDDVNIPLYTRPKIEPKRGVENRLMDKDYSRNPRKRPLDKLFYDVDMPSFVGPLQRDEMWSTAVDVVDRRRHFFQARVDEDWSVHEEIGAILIARKAFRQKNRKSFIEFLMKNHRDVDGLDLTNRYLVEKKNMRRKTTCRDPEPTDPPKAEQK
ncbi:hypothetical protein QR680_014180 [Steinernema hermaphroditum]|uniref:EGF-like domain-containing protein n=1 Tax=Steinernema hermaphroditum TaxID=289476 RepID=A0AA39M3S4_9BILA|nr:hypothetical protein QR680_014180 [Steinernema hermaphroditum]